MRLERETSGCLGWLVAGIIAMVPAFVVAQDTPETLGGATAAPLVESAEPQSGAFHATFTEQDPRSPIQAQHVRHRIVVTDLQKYALADESFEVYVPDDYEPTKAYGILVWVNAGDTGRIPRGWDAICKDHKLIFIGANKSGNRRGVGVRFGLAMDGVYNLKQKYNIDDARVYVTGVSGGGKVASMLGVIYPEIFQGSIPIVGVSYFHGVPLATDPTRGWAPDYTRPPLATYELAQQQTRIVLITGTRDMNHDAIVGTYERGYLPDKFQFVHLIDVPDMGHTLPPAAEMEKAINLLDAPLPQISAKAFERAKDLIKTKKYDAALPLLRQTMLHGTGNLADEAKVQLEWVQGKIAEQPTAGRSNIAGASGAAAQWPSTRPATAGGNDASAQSLLSLAKNYEGNRLYAQARERAERIIKEYPKTPAAVEAKAMLNRLKGR